MVTGHLGSRSRHPRTVGEVMLLDFLIGIMLDKGWDERTEAEQTNGNPADNA